MLDVRRIYLTGRTDSHDREELPLLIFQEYFVGSNAVSFHASRRQGLSD